MKKQKSKNQITEEKSKNILRNLLPESWVIHEYSPDYGIDYVIEIFSSEINASKSYESLGELVYVQLKGAEKVDKRKIKVYPRMNVEKSELAIDESKYIEIDVIDFQIEVSFIETVRCMGSSVPVVVIVIDINESCGYVLCINDYIDKIVLPENPFYASQKTISLRIPADNCLSIKCPCGLSILENLGKRAKLYSAFSKFFYQMHEIEFATGDGLILVQRFLDNILRMDIWDNKHWRIVEHEYEQLKIFNTTIGSAGSFNEIHMECLMKWRQLCNLNNIYEEIVREWFMPTYLAQLSSYPSDPAIIRSAQQVDAPEPASPAR